MTDVKILKRYVKDAMKVINEGSTYLDNNYLSCVGSKKGVKPFKTYKKNNKYLVTLSNFDIEPFKTTNPRYPLGLKCKRKRIRLL